MRTLITADHVLAHDDSGHIELRQGAVLVVDDRIVAVGPASSLANVDHDEHLALGESLLMPGLIDLDALADIDHLILDSWSDGKDGDRLEWSTRYFDEGRHDVLDPGERSTMRRYALTQLALHGITSFMPIASEVHSAWAETHDDLVDVAGIARELGLRTFLGPSYRSGVNVAGDDGTIAIMWNDEEGRRSFAEAVRFLDTVAEIDDPLITGVLAPCRIETVREELLAATARESAARDVLVRVHALQGLQERALIMADRRTTPIGLLERVGLLNDRVVIAHGVYLDLHSEVDGEDRGDLAVLAEAGVSIIHCPLTNNRYAFLLEKLSRYLDAGVNVCLGTDSFPPDLIRGIDAGVQLAKQQHADLSLGLLAEYVEATTVGGARALRRPDLGRIAPGATADMVAFALDDLRLGPVEDPLRTLVVGGTGRDARFSMVGGRVVMRDGVITGVDVEGLRRDGQRIFEKLRDAYRDRDYLAGHAGSAGSGGSAGELFPPVFPVA